MEDEAVADTEQMQIIEGDESLEDSAAVEDGAADLQSSNNFRSQQMGDERVM